MQGYFPDNYCENCHQEGHRDWACPFPSTHTRNMIKCNICGEISHPTSDCPQKTDFYLTQQNQRKAEIFETQYEKFRR
jgi:splicing factor 1